MHAIRSVLALLILGPLVACSSPRDGGVSTFEPIETPARVGATGPRISRLENGLPVLSWMEKRDSGGLLRAAVFGHGGFAPAVDVAADEHMFVNWADTPSVSRLSDAHWVAHWLRYSAEKTYSYDVVVSRTLDAGTTWSEPSVVHDDGTQTEHGFASTYRAGTDLGLMWLDGRQTPEGPMTLRAAVIAEDGSVREEQQVDPNVCDCCQTNIAVSSRGPLAVYRDRTPDEIRDIYISRHDGERWLPGTRLYSDNWRIPGCPVNGPAIVADGDFVAVAWFSAADDKPVVRVIMSEDAGETFAAPVEVAANKALGYVGLDILDPQHVVVSSVAKTDSGANAIHVRAVSTDGRAMPAVHVGNTQQLRVVPQLAVVDDEIVVVWTDEVDGARTMQAAVARWHTP